ncbi:MAG: hypothetical protein IKI57_03020 [Clostridia bacterium]|nr:hypothetical protein [Clostridia bacterium]
MQDSEVVKLEEQSITILKDNHFREVSKEKLESYLYTLMKEMCDLIYLCEMRDYYNDAFEWLISNLSRTAGIQLYSDGEVRINLTWSEIANTGSKCIFMSESELKSCNLNEVLFDELVRILLVGL